MAHILAIGIATLDIVNTLDGYPAEDSEVRARPNGSVAVAMPPIPWRC
jgi:hypothetical protein